MVIINVNHVNLSLVCFPVGPYNYQKLQILLLDCKFFYIIYGLLQ